MGPVPAAHRRAVVVGAGIAGLAVAGQLAHEGWAVTVLEQSPAPRTAGYMIDFFGPGFEAADRMGLLPVLRSRSSLYDSVRYVDGRGLATARLQMDSFRNAAGGRFLSILRPDIEAGLREWLPQSVELRQDARVTGVEPGSAQGRPAGAVLSDGSRLEAELLVGADGIHSAVRRGLFGPEDAFLLPLGYHVVGFVFEDRALADELGGDLVLTDSLERQAGLYALPGGRVAVFGVEATAEPDPPTDPRTAVGLRYAELGWKIPDAMARAGDDLYYDVVAQAIVPTWSRGRAVLVGDAAHAVSFLAGQGASLAVAGAERLADELRHHGHDVGAALDAYERGWRPEVERRQKAGRRNAGFFVPPGRPALWMRRIALRAMGVGPLARIAARLAFGGSVPGKGHRRDRRSR